jgi:hypothetical protein
MNKIETKVGYCYLHIGCILDNMRSATVSNFNAATVVLGLTPTILAAIGPTAAETALLPLHQPLLSLLLSVGSPELYVSRITVIDNSPGHLIVPTIKKV